MKKFIYILVNLPYIIASERLFKQRRFSEIVSLCKARLEKKPRDFISIRNIAMAYAYLGEGDIGFQYITLLFKDIYGKSLLDKIFTFFILPEWKIQNYQVVATRCEALLEIRDECKRKEEVYRYLIESLLKVGAYEKAIETCIMAESLRKTDENFQKRLMYYMAESKKNL